jgi:drug/metabolite transporter (DMT)-like permease
MALMGIAIVAVKPLLSLYPVLWSTTVRMVGGTAALVLISLFRADRRAIWSIFRPQAIWKAAIPAGLLGAYLAFLLWMGGFTYAPAHIAGLLTQMASLFVVILAVLVLKERVTRWKLAALALALTGTFLVIG